MDIFFIGLYSVLPFSLCRPISSAVIQSLYFVAISGVFVFIFCTQKYPYNRPYRNYILRKGIVWPWNVLWFDYQRYFRRKPVETSEIYRICMHYLHKLLRINTKLGQCESPVFCLHYLRHQFLKSMKFGIESLH